MLVPLVVDFEANTAFSIRFKSRQMGRIGIVMELGIAAIPLG